MRISNSFRLTGTALVAGLALAFYSVFVPSMDAHAQGINSDGTDFFCGFMPGIVHGAYFSTGAAAAYFLIGSYADNNTVTIEYIGGPGPGPWPKKQYILQKGICREIPIDPASMVPERPGEVLEYKAAHIYAKYPISIQVYSEGSSNGSMYQAIPTAGLGKSYVVAAYNDNPLADNPGFVNRDSSSSEFEIIAAYDHTNVTFTPNSTTMGGITGVNSGAASSGAPHPVTLEMQRGETYWVRSNSQSVDQDESGSTVVADKPIAVLGGEERAMIGYPSGYWTSLDNDIRDQVGEQMIPVVDWGTDYPTIPAMPASISDVTIVGDGDMYRVYSNDPNGMGVNYWANAAAPYYQYGPYTPKLYSLPATEFDNITDPIDFETATNSLDGAGNLKKFYAVQYMYFQGHHDFDPNRKIGTGKGATPQSGGGDKTLDETTYRAENEMDLVPIDHWRTSALFMVPPNAYYNGYQFINVITYQDSIRNIFITRNNASTGSLANFIPPIKTYAIPQHPELVGLTIKLPSGSYVITGNTPLECYSYGRTETRYKDLFGYAAPCGEAYGSHALPNPPKADVIPSCGEWNIRIHEGGNGGGIAEVLLLDDPDGLYVKPPQVSTNCSLIGNGSDPQNIMSPPFIVGDTSLNFTIQVDDPSKNAYAAVYAVDLSGNDTIIQLSYIAPALTLSADKVTIPDTVVLTQQCSSLTFHLTSTGLYPSVQVFDSAFHTGSLFNISTIPALPANLQAGDSIVYNFCYTPQDTDLHKDSVRLVAGCIDTTLYFSAKGLTPIIVADDHDFGDVTLGDTECALLAVQNIGNAPLILTSGYKLHNNPDYTFEGTAPDTILPGGPKTEKMERFCFHPSVKGTDDSRMDWGTNINQASKYADQRKDTSALLGYGRSSGLSWDRHHQDFTVECTDTQVIRVILQNTSAGASGADLSVNDVHLTGPNASDWSIIDIKGGIATPFQLYKGDDTSTYVDLLFKPNPLVDGFADRFVSLVAAATDNGDNKYYDTIAIVGTIRHAVVTITPSTLNFGNLNPGAQSTSFYTITNTGDTGFVFSGLSFSDPSFTIISGPASGDTLQPGMTDTIFVQGTALLSGGTSNGTFHANGDHIPCNLPTAQALLRSVIAQVAETPGQFPVTYICHNGLSSITASNTGTVGILLDSIQIVDVSGQASASSQFTFVNGTQLDSLMIGVDSGTTLTFPINYIPTMDSSVAVQAVFYWEDTSRGQTRYFQDTKPITGTGYQVSNTVQLQTTNTVYSAVTSSTVTMPLQLKFPFLMQDSIYGASFTLRYYRDEFRNPAVTVAPNVPGLTLVNNPAGEAKADPADNNYELLPIHIASSSPLANTNSLGTVSWQYVVAKDSQSAVTVNNLEFLDASGDSACWAQPFVQNTSFAGLNACGDATLRNFLKGGLPVLSIENVYPNPAQDAAVVNFSVLQDGTPVTLRIYNVLGQVAQTVMQDAPYDKGSYRLGIDATNLPSGLYTIYLTSDGVGVSKQVSVSK